jgi:hypothetical protein
MTDLTAIPAAKAALLFVFAVANVLPMPPGTSTILGAPLVFLAAQLAVGRQPWLPAFIADRTMTRADFARLVRPRAIALAQSPMALGNMLPALAISLLALGVLERDGLRILAGMVTAAASVAFFFREVL